MFFKAAQKGRNFFLYYFLMFLVIAFSQIIGSIPLFMEVLKNPTNAMSGDMAKMLSSISNKNYALLLVALPFVFTFLFFSLTTKPIHNKPLKDWLTGAKRFRWQQFFFAFGIGALFVIGTTLYTYFSAPSDFIVQFDPQKFAIMAILVIVLISIQACTEEIIFRGWLTQGIGLLFQSRLAALLIPSILFGALHLSNPEVVEHGITKMLPLYVIMGLAFGIMTLMNNGTELAMGYHAANNITIALLMTSPESVLQTDAILKMNTPQNMEGQVIPMIVSEIIIIGIFAWKYKWNNWKEKLIYPINTSKQNNF